MLRGFYLILSALLLNLVVLAQEDTGVKFNITVNHKSNAYTDALVKVFKNNSFLDQINVDQQGEFSYLLPYGFVYQLHFTGAGMATKIVELDLISNIPESEKTTVHDWSIGEIELFKSYKEIDLTKLEEPVARIHYETDMYEFSIDYKYTGKRKKELAGVEAQVEKLEKEESVVEKANKKEYEDLVVKGNQALNNKQFKVAKEYFEKAIVLNAEGEAKNKLKAINTVLQREEKYESLLAEAKNAYEKGELQQASEKYISASALKPESQFPVQQIALISQKIKQEEKQANAFNNFIAVANRAYSDGNYDAAAASYKKALAINPDALLATKKLEFSETKIKEKEERDAVNEQFNNLMVEAKNARSRGELAEAKRMLDEAEKLRPNDESFINEKATVTFMITASKEKEAQLAVDQKFNNLIEEAKAASATGNLLVAKQILAKAETIKPKDEKLVAEMLIVETALEDKKKKEELALQQAIAAEREKESKYANYLNLAKKSEAEGKNQEAVFFYEKAKGFKPESKEVNTALALLQKAPQKPKAAEQAVDLDKMDKKSTEFQSKLASLYPEGKTVNNSSKGNKKITQIIMVKEGRGIEYQKIKYNWGGVYYFRNGDPITQLIFEKETK